MQQDRHARASGGTIVGDAVVGRILDGRYRLGHRVARGGMASVYEATDIRLERTVAIKIMHPGLGDDEEFAARFVHEARAAARLSHPNVVAVYDQGADEGTVFLAMELVSGHTLRDTVAEESPLAPARALALMDPVLSALASAHRAGLIHRDVKPENVLIADDGRVKVADFGLAKAVSTDTQATANHGVLIGTVSYLAPELVVDGRADARADVYAAGVMLYELLTGVKPHDGETPIQVAYQHVHHDVPAPSLLVPGLPAYVDALVARATSRDRGLRPADAGVLLHQLHRVSQALGDGVREDAELTQDLAPRPLGGRANTAPEAWDADEMAELLGPPPGRAAREHTTTYPCDLPPPAHPPMGPNGLRPRQPGREPAPPAAPRRRSRRGLLLLALLLVVGLGVGAYWFGWARYTPAPALLGLSQAAAEEKLEEAGLSVDYTDPAYSETVPAGEVIETDPAAGGRVLDGDTVTVTVSQGKERYDVPKLRGLTEDQAQDELLDLKLEYDQSVDRYSESVAEGEVIGSDPQPGTTLRPGAPVDLVVSMGRRPIEVGSWVGEDVDDARDALAERGLELVVSSEEFDDEAPQGEILGQDPGSGTLFKNEEVSVVVSKGPELVEVPSVRAVGVDVATDRLEAAGFEVEIEREDLYLGLGFAVRTDPPSGELAPIGSTLTLYVT